MSSTLNTIPCAISRKEIAMRMFPELKNPDSAVARFRRWLKQDPRALQALYNAGYKEGSHWFTPKTTRVLERFFL